MRDAPAPTEGAEVRIETELYEVDLPEAHAAEILAGIGDADLRQIILDTIAGTPDSEPVTLPLEYGDVVLHALSEWEREQEGGDQ